MSAVTPVRQQQPDPPKRKRPKRAAALRDERVRRTPPAPDAVLAQPGRPLEPGVRRAMEQRLGHDFGAVRIHSDRDAAALAELIGADAVAVGKDIFFADGAYRPETASGLRLLAHELLHTVQIPDAPVRLRLGRDPGALSRPMDGVEREAEARVTETAQPRPDDPVAVEERGTQPVSWLRFISLDVSQLRTEQLDPATVVDRIVAGLVRSLRGDPADASGRVRQQLARLAPELRSTVLARLEKRLPSADYLRIEQLVAAADTAAGAPVDTPVTPEPIVEPADRQDTERRERVEKQTGDDRHRDTRSGDATAEDLQAAEDRDREKSGEDLAEAERKKGGALDDQRKKDAEEEDKQKREDAEHAKAAHEGDKEGGKEGEQAPTVDAHSQAADAQQPAVAAVAPTSTPGGDAEPIGQAPVVGATTAPAAVVGTGGAEPVREDRAEEVARDPQGPLAKHELLREQGKQDEPPEQEKPQETEAGAESEVATPEATAEPEPAEATVDRAEREAGEDKPGPDPVPKTDPDLSAVPTADEDLRLPSGGAPPKPRELPSLPAPPPVEAEPEALEHADRPEQAAGTELAPDEADTPQDKAVDAQAERAERAADDPVRADPAAPVAPAEPSPAPGAEATAPSPATTGAGEPQSSGPAPAPGPAPMASAAPAPVVAGPGASTETEAGTAGRDVAGPDARTPDARSPGEPSPAEPMPGDPQLAEPGPGAAGPPTGPGAAGPEAGPAGPGAGPEGSLEAGGGGCAGAPQSTAETDGQDGGCGGGGGGGGAPAPAEQKAEAQPPDVSGQEPREALATIGSQPPARMPRALGGVEQAVGTTVGQEHQDLQAAPPTVGRPSGAPQTLTGAPQVGTSVATPTEPLAVVTPETLVKQREANPPPTANTPNPADRVRAPVVAGGNQEQATDAEIQQMQGAVNGVPTSDDRLYTTVGAAPKVKLEGETDPALADEQHRQTGERISQTQALGRQDAAVGLGEDQVYPNVPGGTLSASVPGRTPAGAGSAAGPKAGGLDPDTVSAVAVQERGPQIQAGFADGQGKMGQARQDKQTQSDEAREDSRAQVEQAVAENSDQQAAVRQRTAEDAAGKRGEWRGEQDKAVEDNTKTANDEHAAARQDTAAKKTEVDADIEARRSEDNERIEKQRKEAEEKARKEREAKKEESSGWWGWVKSKVKAAFDALVSAIKGLFDLAVKAINAIKEGFKKAINGLIDLAAKAITGIIKGLANALLAVVSVIGTVFPGIAEKMRKAIVSLRDGAIQKVQQLADGLKKAVNALIDALAGALVAVLRAYETLLLAAVEVVRGVVMAAIEFVESAVKLLGELAALIKDIAPDPIGWIRKLGTAARDGIRNFLWGAIKTAVKEWFNAKVESVIGIGKLLWNVLIKGCLSVAQIGKMAWQAIVKSLPAMIIAIVIEKVISLLVPAAGGIIAIAQGVMAAYQSISRIIAAFSAFLTFLKAVKVGGVAAACLFAKAVAAGAVALLEFIANFLMVRIAGALKGVGSRLKGIAEKIMKGLGRGAKTVRKAAGRTVNAARQAVRGGVAAVKRGAVASARAVRRGVTAGARAVRSGVRRVGGAARDGLRGAATGVRRAAAAVGRVVAPAVRTVGRTMKRLGSKVANSKLGRALAKSAKGLKNLVKCGKEKFKDWRKKVTDRRKQRKADKKKKPQESKEQRLARIIARLRPLVRRMARRGVRESILKATLLPLRAWYRLKRLHLVGSPVRNVLAGLSPGEPFLPLDEAGENELLRILREEVEAEVRSPRHQEMAREVGAERMDPRQIEAETWRTSQRVAPQLPSRVTSVTAPSGVSPLALASGMAQLISQRKIARARLITLGAKTPVVIASQRVTGSDPAGRWRPMVQGPGGVWRPDDSVRLDYPGFGEAAAADPATMVQGLQHAQAGNFDALGRMSKQTQIASMVPLGAEPMRGPYPAITGPASVRLSEAALAGRPGGVPVSETLRTMPYSQPGSVGSSRVMEHRERRAAGESVRPREPWFRQRPGGESPEALRARVVTTLRGMLLVEGVVTEKGGRGMAQEMFLKLVRMALRDPAMRRRLFGEH